MTFLKEMQKCVGQLEYISLYMCQQDYKLLIHCSQMQELQDELQQQKERAGKLVKDSQTVMLEDFTVAPVIENSLHTSLLHSN